MDFPDASGDTAPHQEMKYWILMFRPETYLQVQEKNTIGVHNQHRKRFAALSKGDRFVAYISRICQLDSHGEFVGEPYVDEAPLFENWRRYTQRCAVEFRQTGAHLPVKDLLFTLSAFQGELKTLPANMLFCKGGFMEITADDYEHFRSLVDGAAKP